MLGFYLFTVHVLTTETHFLNKALLKDRNFVLSAVMFFAFGFVLLPTVALQSPMLDEVLNYPPDTTGYIAIPRSIALLAALILVNHVPIRIDTRPLIAGGASAGGLRDLVDARLFALDALGGWWSRPACSRAPVSVFCCRCSAKSAFSTLDPKLRPEGTVVFNLARLYGSTIGIAVVLTFFYNNTQAMHGALAKNITPYRAAAHAAAALPKHGLAHLNDMITGQAALIGVIGQFKILMVVMLVVSPLVLLLRKPRPIN